MHPARQAKEQVLDLWQAGFARREIAGQLGLPTDKRALNILSDVIYDARGRQDPRADRTRWTPPPERPQPRGARIDARLLAPALGIEKAERAVTVLSAKSGELSIVYVSVPRVRLLEGCVA